MRRMLLNGKIAIASATALIAVMTLAVGSPGPASASTNGAVTSTTIRIGIPYIDFSALASVGVKLNQGSVQDAYNALIANLNAHGGINGRKVVAVYAPVNPTNTTSALAVCTQLTEDTPVFVAMSPYMPDCYLSDHDTPTLNATLPGQLPRSAAANFTLSPPPSAYDPVQLGVFDKMGLFKGKKVALVASKQNDLAELSVVQSTLKRLHVNVVQTAISTALATDQTALDQQTAAFVQKFQSEGVDEVVAVGSASGGWPVSLTDIQSSFNPPWIATSSSTLSGVIAGGSANTSYLEDLTTSIPGPSSIQEWTEPLVQQCVSVIKKAYPSDTITPPSSTSNSSDHTYIAPESACQDMAMFVKIARAAGKKLTVASFTQAGYSLRNVTFPGSGGPVSFGPGRPYAVGPVFVGKYSAATKQIVFSAKSATS